MVRPLTGADGFVDDADASQPRITIQIDGGIVLDDAERVLRDFMIHEFVDDLVTAVRNFYTVREQLGPPKRPLDADKLAAALAEVEASAK